MNHLNSIVVEGNVKGSVNYTEQVSTSVFEIEVKRDYKDGNNGKMKSEFTVVSIKAVGTLGVSAAKSGVDGRGVRIVGRLMNSGSQVMVFAEALDWKQRPVSAQEFSDLVWEYGASGTEVFESQGYPFNIRGYVVGAWAEIEPMLNKSTDDTTAEDAVISSWYKQFKEVK